MVLQPVDYELRAEIEKVVTAAYPETAPESEDKEELADKFLKSLHEHGNKP